VNDNLKKKLSELLGKVDSKVLEAKINQAVEMIKNGEHEEIINTLNKMDKDEVLEKISEMENLPKENLDALKNKIGLNLSGEELTSIQKKLNPEGKKIIDKMISTFKTK
jgi:hypothetical protein